ncbi:hypothetical protein V491_09264 [Pseudogymnoascus sp. VKM F-3775]|nr:hypothetical protein V491_09264 [Pseudogymnoascus sp. VKM F-3775]
MAVVENMCALMLDTDGGAKRVPWRDEPVPTLGDTEEGASDIPDIDRRRAAWQAYAGDEPAGRPYGGQQDAPDAVHNACPPMTTSSDSSGSTPLSSTMAYSFSEQGPQSYDSKKRKLELLTSDLDDQNYTFGPDLEELHRRLGDEAAHRNDVVALNRWIAKRQALGPRHNMLDK